METAQKAGVPQYSLVDRYPLVNVDQDEAAGSGASH
jgi:hypothetical protein